MWFNTRKYVETSVIYVDTAKQIMWDWFVSKMSLRRLGMMSAIPFVTKCLMMSSCDVTCPSNVLEWCQQTFSYQMSYDVLLWCHLQKFSLSDDVSLWCHLQKSVRNFSCLMMSHCDVTFKNPSKIICLMMSYCDVTFKNLSEILQIFSTSTGPNSMGSRPFFLVLFGEIEALSPLTTMTKYQAISVKS